LVRLQKRFAYKYKDKEHYKHVVTVPEEAVKKLGWNEGDELQYEVKESKLVFTSTKRRKSGA